MKKEAKDKHFIKKPIFEGGPKAMKKFVKENLRYPKLALKNKIEGSVYVKYDIDHKGKVIDAKVVSGIGHGCDEEALRLVKKMEFIVPKTPYKTKVVFHNNIQIHFRLPKAKKAPQKTGDSLQINYTSSSSSNQKKNPPKSNGGGYGYTISIG